MLNGARRGSGSPPSVDICVDQVRGKSSREGARREDNEKRKRSGGDVAISQTQVLLRIEVNSEGQLPLPPYPGICPSDQATNRPRIMALHVASKSFGNLNPLGGRAMTAMTAM